MCYHVYTFKGRHSATRHTTDGRLKLVVQRNLEQKIKVFSHFKARNRDEDRPADWSSEQRGERKEKAKTTPKINSERGDCKRLDHERPISMWRCSCVFKHGLKQKMQREATSSFTFSNRLTAPKFETEKLVMTEVQVEAHQNLLVKVRQGKRTDHTLH